MQLNAMQYYLSRDEEQRPLCEVAIRFVRGIIPPDIFKISKAKLAELGVPKELCQRIFNKRILWLVRMSPESISKIHAAELQVR